MVSSKLLLASVTFAVLALALAKQQSPRNKGPGAPNEMREPNNRPEGKGGRGKSKEQSRSSESREGSHEGGPCSPAEGPLMSMFDNSTLEAIAAIWSNYTDGENCTELLEAQEAVLKDAFIAILDAEAEKFTDAAKEVYEMFKFAFLAFESLSPEDQGALMTLKSFLDPLGGEGSRERKHDGGPRFGPMEGRSGDAAGDWTDF